MNRSLIRTGLLALTVIAFTLLPSAAPGTAPDQARADNLFPANGAASAFLDATQLTGCEQSVNDTLAKLDACVTQASLWSRLSHFQLISDQNKCSDGHGCRDTGTPGYKASVDFVAKLMRQAGYHVTVQAYPFFANVKSGTPVFNTANQRYALERDWFVARRSGSGSVNAPVAPPNRSRYGCFANDFVGFRAGDIALMERGECSLDAQVANAQRAGARAAILYTTTGAAYEARLNDPVNIPVIAVASGSVGTDLLRQYVMGRAPAAHIDIQMRRMSVTDYNVIADSPFGNAHHTVVIDGHLDSIYGAGMLDNASGSASILETALAMAKTPTRNRLRYIWFGGEELGLVGSSYYTTHLTQAQLQRIVFDVDVDVSATPNFDIQIADPALASDSFLFRRTSFPAQRSATRRSWTTSRRSAS